MCGNSGGTGSPLSVRINTVTLCGGILGESTDVDGEPYTLDYPCPVAGTGSPGISDTGYFYAIYK